MITTATPAVAAGTYEIDPAASTVTFRTSHAFGLGPVTGTFAVRTGRITVGGPTSAGAEVILDAASFTTDQPRRDRDVTGKRFLDAASYPDIRFGRTSLREHADGGWALTGELTVKGVALPLTLRVTELAATGPGLRATATARVDRFAAGLRAGRGLIARYLDVTVEVTARRH